MASNIVKVKYQDVTYRVALPQPPTLEALNAEATKRFVSAKQPISFTYVDADGDTITLYETADLAAAVASAGTLVLHGTLGDHLF
jgi:hypothetical protein